jgi:hypothetical protein
LIWQLNRACFFIQAHSIVFLIFYLEQLQVPLVFAPHVELEQLPFVQPQVAPQVQAPPLRAPQVGLVHTFPVVQFPLQIVFAVVADCCSGCETYSDNAIPSIAISTTPAIAINAIFFIWITSCSYAPETPYMASCETSFKGHWLKFDFFWAISARQR